MNVGDIRDAGLSPPAAYPSTVERETYSPDPPYLSNMLACIETTQIPLGPQPYGSIGKGLGHTRRHDEPPPQLRSNSIHISYMND
jgi:hypothetical protein